MSALRQTAWYAVATLAGRGIGFLMLPVITGHLSPADYGVLELLAAVADAGGILLGFGLTDTLFRFVAQAGPGEREVVAAKVLGQAVALSLLGLALVLAVLGAFSALVPAPLRPEQMAIVAVSLAAGTCVQVPLAWLRLTDRAGLYVGSMLGRGVLQATLVSAALVGGFGVTGMLAATALVDTALAVLLVIRQARRTGLVLGLHRPLLAYGGPLVLSGLAGFVLGSLDRWFLVGAVPVEAIGRYGLAVKLALLVPLAMQPFELWWYPRRLAVLAGPDGDRRHARIAALGIAWVLAAAAGAALAGPFAVRLLTPEPYHAATAWLPWLALAAVLQITGSLVNVRSYARRTGTIPSLVNAAAAGVTLLGYLTLIPAHGVAGAVASTIVGMSVRLVLFLAMDRILAARAPALA
jgi:O-antigen/teichoic acid export membrane protein